MQHADKLETLPVDSLVPYARNARTHSPEQVAAVARSIQRFGFTNPVLIDAEGGIVAGHGRVLAAKSLGVGSVPCLRVGWLSEAEKRAYVLADNKLAELAGWDDELLAGELRALQADDFDLSLTGFAQEELDDLLIDKTEGKTDADAVPPAPTIPVTQPGDVWVLGRHRVMCGDSTDAGSVALLMRGDRADACWTDPPYNVAYETTAGKIDNDDMSDDDFRKFLGGFYRAAHAVMKKGSAIYVAHADTERANFTGEFLRAGFKLSGVIIWRKDSLVLGRSDYQWIHEPILYGWKEGGGAQVLRWPRADHCQRHRQQRLSIREACRRKVANRHWRRTDDRRWRCEGRVGGGFDHA